MKRSVKPITVLVGLAVLALAVRVVELQAKPKFNLTEDMVRSLSPEMRREVGALQYLLNPYQLRQFFDLPSDSLRGEWIDAYWRALDPTPTTGTNEMMVEHYVRVRLAREFFGSATWPGWDKRGEIFIRYGPPNYRGKIHAEVTARKVHPPGELWFYKKHAMVIQFEDFDHDGDFKYAIKPLGVARDMNPELMEFLLYDTEDALQEQIPDYLLNFQRPAEILDDPRDWTKADEMLGGVKPEIYVNPRMRGLHEGMDEIIDPDTGGMVPDNPSTTFHQDRIREYANNFEVVLEEQPSSYPFNFEDKSLPFYFAVDQFVGGEGVNRIEVNVEFPADLSPGERKLEEKTYTASAVFLDADYNVVARESHDITLPTVSEDSSIAQNEANGTGENTRLVPAQLVFTLPRGYYRLAVNVEERVTERKTAYRTTMTYNDYRYDLAISDIVFASKIEPARRQSPFNRGALEVVPHPIRLYRRSTPVPVYFEIYNLELDDDGLSRYSVEYRIVPASAYKSGFWDRFDSATPVVSSEFESSSHGPTDRLYISIDTDNLPEGRYDVLVTVKDGITLAVVYRKDSFTVVE